MPSIVVSSSSEGQEDVEPDDPIGQISSPPNRSQPMSSPSRKLTGLGVIGSMDFSVFLACSGHAPPAPWENWLHWSDFRSLEARGAAEDLQAVDPAVLLITVVRDSLSAPSAVTPTPAPEAVVSVSMEPVKNPLCISGADSSTEEASSPFSLTSFSSNSTPSDKNKTNEAVIIVSSPERDILVFLPHTLLFLVD